MYAVAELNRRLESLIRPGTIAAVDLAKARVRVKTGGLLTAWLPWFARRAGATLEWSPPTLNEQCLLLCPSGNTALGFVLVGVYCNDFPAPNSNGDEWELLFPDGAHILYNHVQSVLTVSGIKTATIQASSSCKVDCPDAEFTGNLIVRKKLIVEGGAELQKNVEHSGGNLTSNGIVVHTHKHGGVTPGGGMAGAPV